MEHVKLGARHCKRVIEIPKGKGKTRTIFVPSRHTIRWQQCHLFKLWLMVSKLYHADELHCVPARNSVTNAQAHIGFRFSLSLDVHDCFNTIDLNQCKYMNNRRTKAIKDFTYRSQYARSSKGVRYEVPAVAQGLPAAPAIANLMLSAFDELMISECKKHAMQFAFTRYLDDITISCDDRDLLQIWSAQSHALLFRATRQRFNESKTKIQDGKYRRRHITGVAIDDEAKCVKPTRKSKRRARASKHRSERGAKAVLSNSSQVAKMRRELHGRYVPKDETRMQQRLEQIARGHAEWVAIKQPKQTMKQKLILGILSQ